MNKTQKESVNEYMRAAKLTQKVEDEFFAGRELSKAVTDARNLKEIALRKMLRELER